MKYDTTLIMVYSITRNNIILRYLEDYKINSLKMSNLSKPFCA